jgi:glutamate racemase
MRPKIAVLDWGIGGLPTFYALQKALPNYKLGYFSDSGFPPYGKVEPQSLNLRLDLIRKDLGLRGFGYLVVACNALSTVLGPKGMRPSDKNQRLPEVQGIIQPFLQNHLGLFDQKTLVIGGHRVTASQAYRGLSQLGDEHIQHRSGQSLSAMIEEGITDEVQIHRAITAIASPKEDFQHIVLACTHYPAYSHHFHMLFPSAAIYDPMNALLEQVIARLNRDQDYDLVWDENTNDQQNPKHFFTTGSPDASALSAQKVFGTTPLAFQPWEIDEN